MAFLVVGSWTRLSLVAQLLCKVEGQEQKRMPCHVPSEICQSCTYNIASTWTGMLDVRLLKGEVRGEAAAAAAAKAAASFVATRSAGDMRLSDFSSAARAPMAAGASALTAVSSKCSLLCSVAAVVAAMPSPSQATCPAVRSVCTSEEGSQAREVVTSRSPYRLKTVRA